MTGQFLMMQQLNEINKEIFGRIEWLASALTALAMNKPCWIKRNGVVTACIVIGRTPPDHYNTVGLIVSPIGSEEQIVCKLFDVFFHEDECR